MAHAKERPLKQAPITEAVIELQVKTEYDFGSYDGALRAAFLDFFDTAGASERAGRRGLIFPAEPKVEAVQVSEIGFAFSKLQPYTSWDDVLDSARRFWEVYRRVVDITAVERIGVRFINHFHLRHDQHLDDYLTVLPQAPETVVPHEVTDTLSRITIQDSERAISARVFYVWRADETGTTVIIDTDASKLGTFDPDQVWETFQELRELKNRIFFGSITETAAKEFDQ
jgi:uncharacterized protein (TIGR04255 family)